MLAITLTALLAVASGETAAPSEAPFRSLALELAAPPPAAPAVWSALPLQGAQGSGPPRGFIAIGVHLLDEDVSSSVGDSPESDTAFSLDLGLYTWNDSLGLAIEVGYLASSYEIDVSALASDKVDVSRYLLGLRFADDEAESPFLYHLRGGLAFREDQGDVIDDSGQGWYFGGGIEWKFPAGFSLGPQLLYIDTSSRDSSEWVLGLEAALAF